MQFVYAPAGSGPESRRVWPFDPVTFPGSDAATIEKLTGLTWYEFRDRLQRGSVVASRALLFVLMRRDAPGLRFEHVDPSPGEVGLDFTDEESHRMVLAIEKAAESGDATEAQLEVAETLRAQLAASGYEPPAQPESDTAADAGEPGDVDPKGA